MTVDKVIAKIMWLPTLYIYIYDLAAGVYTVIARLDVLCLIRCIYGHYTLPSEIRHQSLLTVTGVMPD